jgi:hypothetical protein
MTWLVLLRHLYIIHHLLLLNSSSRIFIVLIHWLLNGLILIHHTYSKRIIMSALRSHSFKLFVKKLKILYLNFLFKSINSNSSFLSFFHFNNLIWNEIILLNDFIFYCHHIISIFFNDFYFLFCFAIRNEGKYSHNLHVFIS